jgi:hypothetical protein
MFKLIAYSCFTFLLFSQLFASGQERKILYKFERIAENLSANNMFQICPKVNQPGNIATMRDVMFNQLNLSERSFKEKICKKPDYGFRLNSSKTNYTEIQCTGGAEYFYIKADCFFTGNPTRLLKVTPAKNKYRLGEVIKLSYEGGDPEFVSICLAPIANFNTDCIPNFKASAPNPIGIAFIDTKGLLKPDEKSNFFEIRIYGGKEKHSPFVKSKEPIEVFQKVKK